MYSRYLSLIYFARVQNLTIEDREKFDQALADANRTIVAGESPEPRPRTPSWWPGDEAVTRDNLEAAKAMGFVVGKVT